MLNTLTTISQSVFVIVVAIYLLSQLLYKDTILFLLNKKTFVKVLLKSIYVFLRTFVTVFALLALSITIQRYIKELKHQTNRKKL